MRFLSIAMILMLGSVLGAQTPAPAQNNAAPKGDAANGKKIFASYGCYQCHGYEGQGGVGARLAPKPLAYQAFAKYVRQRLCCARLRNRLAPTTAACYRIVCGLARIASCDLYGRIVSRQHRRPESHLGETPSAVAVWRDRIRNRCFRSPDPFRTSSDR